MMNWDSLSVLVRGCESASSPNSIARLTLHITFTFIDNESITFALAVAILDYTYTFDGAVHFEFSSQVDFRRFLRLPSQLDYPQHHHDTY